MTDKPESTPERPLDRWRVCNRPISQDCTCPAHPWGVDRAVAVAAAKRLAGEL